MAEDFDHALATVIRRARERAGLRQEDVSAAARSWGLTWTPATVAGIETGRRHVSAPELLLLPFVLRAQGEEPVALAELLEELGDVQLTEDAATNGTALAAIARGEALKALESRSWDTPGTRSLRAAMKTASDELSRGRDLYGLRPKAVIEAGRDAGGEAERNASYRLGVPAVDIAMAARKLWGHGLSEERDARAQPGASPQARGRITRQLLDELAPVVGRERGTR